MLKENQKIEMRWSGRQQQYYKDKGYQYTKQGDSFMVNVEDLYPNSYKDVVVICDCCGKEIKRPYCQYLKSHDSILGDTCKECSKIKWKRTNLEKYRTEWFVQTDRFRDKRKEAMIDKYGTVHALQVDKFKNKFIETMNERYGVDYALQSEQLQQKNIKTCLEKYNVPYTFQSEQMRKASEQTCLEKYGYKNTALVPEIRAKQKQSMYKNGTVPTSKSERKLCKLLLQMFGKQNCYPGYPLDRINMDCMLNINDCKIDVEYDGQYWHKDKQDYDDRRDAFVKSQGYKILRIKGNYQIPTQEQLNNSIQRLVKGDEYAEIILDI